MTTKFEDLRQSEEWATYLTCIGWQVRKFKVQNSNFKIFIRELPLIGSVGKIQRPSVVPAVEEIDRIAKRHRALFVKLEPSLQRFIDSKSRRLRTNLTIQQFSSDNWPLSPTRTIHIDLTPTEEEIFAKFSKDGRYSIRKAQNLGVAVVCKAWPFLNLRIFHQLLCETGSRKKFWVAPFKDLQAKAEAFKDKSVLISAYRNYERNYETLPAGRQAIAGALILFHDNVAYYHQAASNLEGRRLLAPYLVVWEAIKLAKDRGCHTLDLEGIYDPRYKIYKRFRKIGVFKKKFGGREIEYPGSFVRYYNPIIKLIFKLTSWR